MSHRSVVLSACAIALLFPSPARAQETSRLDLRGHPQAIRLYGPAGHTPVVVASGDGGWIHLGPRVAEMLAGRGCSVVGFDAKAYLSSFTASDGRVREEDVSGDFATLTAYARARGDGTKPVLVGVSEGAALAVLAATDSRTRDGISGVIGLGLGDLNELAWRWRDVVIYFTHGVPNEPTFSVLGIVDRVSPAPLALIQSTHDEFVAPAVASAVFERAREPRRRWIVDASDHRFSGATSELNNALIEAFAWIAAQQ